jgi:hypothetical protein
LLVLDVAGGHGKKRKMGEDNDFLVSVHCPPYEVVVEFEELRSAQFYPVVQASPDRYFNLFSQDHPGSWDNLDELGSLCGDVSEEESVSEDLGTAAQQDETDIEQTKIPPPKKPKELSLTELQIVRARWAEGGEAQEEDTSAAAQQHEAQEEDTGKTPTVPKKKTPE